MHVAREMKANHRGGGGKVTCSTNFKKDERRPPSRHFRKENIS